MPLFKLVQRKAAGCAVDDMGSEAHKAGSDVVI